MAECIYNRDEFCTNDQCPMCADYCPVPDDEGVCRYEEREEDNWVLTPKGCFIAALTDYIKLDEDIIDFIWNEFAYLMKKHGYVEEE